VAVRDSTGTSRSAEVFYVSPLQVGYRIPTATATGFATATIMAAGASTSGALNIVSAYPNAFQLSTDGLAQAYITRARGGFETAESAAQLRDGAYVMTPIDLGPAGDEVYLVLYVTGLGSATTITATIAGVDAPFAFAGAEGVYPGIEIVKMRIPRELSGAGKVNVVVTADGKSSTPVYVGIK